MDSLPRGYTATHSWTWGLNPVPQARIFWEGQLSAWYQARVGLKVGKVPVHSLLPCPWGWLSGVAPKHPFSHLAAPLWGLAKNSPPSCRDWGILGASLNHTSPSCAFLRLAFQFLSPLRRSLSSWGLRLPLWEA